MTDASRRPASHHRRTNRAPLVCQPRRRTTMSELTTLSDDLSDAVATAAKSVVTVHGGRRFGASGVVWRPGVVVTTDHALEQDDEIGVTLPDGTRVGAKVAGRDGSTDLAILKIEATT